MSESVSSVMTVDGRPLFFWHQPSGGKLRSEGAPVHEGRFNLSLTPIRSGNELDEVLKNGELLGGPFASQHYAELILAMPLERIPADWLELNLAFLGTDWLGASGCRTVACLRWENGRPMIWFQCDHFCYGEYCAVHVSV